VLVGEIARGRSLNIIGVGVAPARGVLKGEVVDYKAACEATHQALEMAEKRAGARIHCIALRQRCRRTDRGTRRFRRDRLWHETSGS